MSFTLLPSVHVCRCQITVHCSLVRLVIKSSTAFLHPFAQFLSHLSLIRRFLSTFRCRIVMCIMSSMFASSSMLYCFRICTCVALSSLPIYPHSPQDSAVLCLSLYSLLHSLRLFRSIPVPHHPRLFFPASARFSFTDIITAALDHSRAFLQ